MKTLSIKYEPTLSDYRMAMYHGLFQRHRTPLRLMFIFIIFSLMVVTAYLFGMIGAIGYYSIVFFAATAYVIWALVMFAGTEKNIRRYIKSEEKLVGCLYHITMDNQRLSIKVPEKNVDTSFKLAKLACAFELSSIFLVYTSAVDVYILPKKTLSSEERLFIQALFAKNLGKRFFSRFLNKPEKSA